MLVVMLIGGVLHNGRDKPRSPRHSQYGQMRKAFSLSLHVGFIGMFYCIIRALAINNSVSTSTQTSPRQTWAFSILVAENR